MKTPKEIEGQDLIYFPAVGRVISYFGELETNPEKRTRILKEQHEWWQSHRGATRYATCQCNPGEALFYVRAEDIGNSKRRYSLARFPNSSTRHDSQCYFHRQEVPRTRELHGETAKDVRRGDLAALFVSRGDPEKARKAVSVKKGDPESQTKSGTNAITASLRRLGTELLRRSGVCEWRPCFKDRRNFRCVDGLIAGAFQKLLADATSPHAQLLANLGPDVLLGSWTHTTRQASDSTATKILAFGFVTKFGPPSANGSRELTFFNHQTPPLLVPARVLAAATKNPRVIGTDCVINHPLWIICVAERFADQWKAHKIACFRLTRTGLIPVESDQEELMVEHLIESERKFRRPLTPAEGKKGFVPDFALVDITPEHFVEVAGLTDTEYLRRLETKSQHWAGKLTVWHTCEPLTALKIPPPDSATPGSQAPGPWAVDR